MFNEEGDDRNYDGKKCFTNMSHLLILNVEIFSKKKKKKLSSSLHATTLTNDLEATDVR